MIWSSLSLKYTRVKSWSKIQDQQHRLRWFGHIQRRPLEALVRSGVISQASNGKRGRGRPTLTWEKSKGDLKDWSITQRLALDRRERKVAIHVPEPWYSVSPILLTSYVNFFLFIRSLLPFCVSKLFIAFPPLFLCFKFFIAPLCLVFYCPSVFPLLFHLCFCLCFSGPMAFISSLPQLAWN
jgi:hypothetical protein